MSTTVSPAGPPAWSPTPAPVLLGAGWVLVGGLSYLVTTRPLVLVVALAATALTTAASSARERRVTSSRAAADASLPEVVIDLAARLSLDAGRR